MKIEQLMTSPVRTIGQNRTLDSAAELMWSTDCGSLPVVNEQGEVVAMLTDRDICMHAWSTGRPLSELTVRAAMSPNLIACRSSDTVSEAEGLMRNYQIRRLPVVDSQHLPVGMLSLGDLTREALVDHGSSTQEVGDAEVVETLAAVCKPLWEGTLQPARVANN